MNGREAAGVGVHPLLCFDGSSSTPTPAFEGHYIHHYVVAVRSKNISFVDLMSIEVIGRK